MVLAEVVKMKLGETLRSKRKELGLSQQKMGLKIYGKVGGSVAQKRISNIESGLLSVRKDLWRKFSSAYGIALTEIAELAIDHENQKSDSRENQPPVTRSFFGKDCLPFLRAILEANTSSLTFSELQKILDFILGKLDVEPTPEITRAYVVSLKAIPQSPEKEIDDASDFLDDSPPKL
jgi:transcriptional regulator with XRE-family HTH domain